MLNRSLGLFFTSSSAFPARAHTYRTLTTPFIYYPRTAPARGIPPRLEPKASSPGLHITPEWRVHESPIAVRLPGLSKSIICKFYTPASHVLCMRRAIPYHITFTGPGLALTTLLTYMPSRTGAAAVRACSRIQLIRQTSVDVKCVCRSLHAVRTSSLTYVQPSIIRNEYAEVGATSEMWRTRSIGDGSLCRSVRQINFLLPVSAYVGLPRSSGYDANMFLLITSFPDRNHAGRWHRLALICWRN